MAGPGIGSFDPLYLLPYAWFDGAFVLVRLPIDAPDAPSVIPLATQGGTHFVQRPYRGAVKPKDYNAKRFTVNMVASDQASWESAKRTKAKCAPFYFAYGTRQADAMALTSGGPVGRLSRPLASGIVTGVTELDYETVIRLNDAVSPSAAAVAGQTVTQTTTGVYVIEYTPAYLVSITSWSESVIGRNRAEISATLEETLVA